MTELLNELTKSGNSSIIGLFQADDGDLDHETRSTDSVIKEGAQTVITTSVNGSARLGTR